MLTSFQWWWWWWCTENLKEFLDRITTTAKIRLFFYIYYSFVWSMIICVNKDLHSINTWIKKNLRKISTKENSMSFFSLHNLRLALFFFWGEGEKYQTSFVTNPNVFLYLLFFKCFFFIFCFDKGDLQKGFFFISKKEKKNLLNLYGSVNQLIWFCWWKYSHLIKKKKQKTKKPRICMTKRRKRNQKLAHTLTE